MIFLTFGTGMGAGLILNGQLYTGSTGSAGKVGPIRLERNGPEGLGKTGSFEGFCSGGGIAELAKTLAFNELAAGRHPLCCPDASQLASVTAKSVAEAAAAGDHTAEAVYRASALQFGRGGAPGTAGCLQD